MAKKDLHVTIEVLKELKKLGLLSKSQRKNKRRKAKRAEKNIKSAYVDSLGHPKASSENMQSSGSSQPLTHTSNIATDFF